MCEKTTDAIILGSSEFRQTIIVASIALDSRFGELLGKSGRKCVHQAHLTLRTGISSQKRPVFRINQAAYTLIANAEKVVKVL